MLKRLLVLGLITVLVMMIRPDDAEACSCLPLTPAEDLAEFDAAFVGRLIDGPTNQMIYVEDAPWRFEVETWVKGDMGNELIVHAPNQSSACGFEAPMGERVGVLIHVDEAGQARGSLCSTVDADLLLAGDRPLVVDGSGPPVFLVAAYQGPGRLMVLDASGGLLAAVGEPDGGMGGLDLCPGSELLVELVDDKVVVRSVPDLAEVRRIDLAGLPFEKAVTGLWCRDDAASEVWLGVDEWSEAGGSHLRVVAAADLDRTLVDGGYGMIDVGKDHAVAGEGPTGQKIWRIDLGSGERVLLHEIPIEPGDSEPSGFAWIDDSGTRVMITEWRYNDAEGGSTTLFLYELATGDLVWQSEPMATSDGLGWDGNRWFLAYSYQDINSDEVEFLQFDAETLEISRLRDLPGWSGKRVGDHRAGVDRGHLRIVPIEGGDPLELRLLPSQDHYLAAVLDPEAMVTPTTTVPVAPPTLEPSGSETDPTVPSAAPIPPSEAEQTDTGPIRATVIGSAVVALLLLVLWRIRRSRPG